MSNDAKRQAVAPRRRSKKRKTILGLAPRIILIVVMLVITGAGSWAIITKIAQPFQMRNQELTQVNAVLASLQ